MPIPKNVRVMARVEGHVQGVGFRRFVYDSATELDLTGWVRNTYAGDVEVCAEGPRATLEDLLDTIRRGPGFVTQVDTQWESATDEFTIFMIVRTV